MKKRYIFIVVFTLITIFLFQTNKTILNKKDVVGIEKNNVEALTSGDIDNLNRDCMGKTQIFNSALTDFTSNPTMYIANFTGEHHFRNKTLYLTAGVKYEIIMKGKECAFSENSCCDQNDQSVNEISSKIVPYADVDYY